MVRPAVVKDLDVYIESVTTGAVIPFHLKLRAGLDDAFKYDHS